MAVEEPISRGHKPSAWRIVKPIIKPLLPVCFKNFPESRNIMRYRDTFGRLPNIIRPKTLNEKILRKILFDRNPSLTMFADKFLVRGFVRSRLGDDQCLTKLYAVVASADEICHLSLPAQFVMKPNHASGMLKIVRDSISLLPGELENLAAEWLTENFYDSFQEWAYKNIKPRVIFEELLEHDGNIPDDWKFFCFDGEPRFVQIDRGRFVKHHRNLYDLNLLLLPARDYRYDNFEDELKAPRNFGKMLEIARRLSAGTDFVRVDMYNIKGRIVFGELTNYPSNGRGRFEPPEWDLKFGSWWK